MKFEVTINTVNSASWMLLVAHGDFSVRTDKATFNVFTPDEYSRKDALDQLSHHIREFNLFTPDMSDNGVDITREVCRSFEDAADELSKLNVGAPINYYRSWTYDKHRTAVIAVKEI